MSKKINYIISDLNITVNYDGQNHIIPKDTALAEQLIDALRNKKIEEIPNLISAAKRIENLSEGIFTVKDGTIFVKGQPVAPQLGQKIMQFSNEGLPFEPLVKFAENLQRNPSYRAINELFQFLEKNNHPITENGNFIAYKRVRENFTDIHSGKFDNSIGNLVEMPRNQVNEDPTQTCSAGLHVANWDYAHNHYASSNPDTDVMVEVEVDPANVVAVPIDYNQSKMRVCAYTVLGVIDHEHSSDMSIRYTTTVDEVEEPESDVEEEFEPEAEGDLFSSEKYHDDEDDEFFENEEEEDIIV